MRNVDDKTYTWKGAREYLRRLGEANARATEAWLVSLTPEESIRIFEDLCRGIPELDVLTDTDGPPPVLCRAWRR